LHGLVRNDLYTLNGDENRSTLECGVGDVLKDRYDFEHNERVTLEVKGNPQCNGDDSRLELIYEEHAVQFRVQHPVRIQPDTLREQREDPFTHTLDPENTTQAAAIDVGAMHWLLSPNVVRQRSLRLVRSLIDSRAIPSESPHSSRNSQTINT
jgi:putative transposase